MCNESQGPDYCSPADINTEILDIVTDIQHFVLTDFLY